MKKTMFVDWCNNKQGGINPLDYFVGYELPNSVEYNGYEVISNAVGDVSLLKDAGVDDKTDFYWWQCSECGDYFEAKVRQIYKNNQEVKCRYCNGNKNKNVNGGTVDDWLKNHNDIEYIGAMIYWKSNEHSFKDASGVFISQVNPKSIGEKRDKKVLIKCKKHNYYKSVRAIDLCKDNFKMDCCEDTITIQDWCLLFWHHIFSTVYNCHGLSYNGELAYDYSNSPKKELAYSVKRFDYIHMKCKYREFSPIIRRMVQGNDWCDDDKCKICEEKATKAACNDGETILECMKESFPHIRMDVLESVKEYLTLQNKNSTNLNKLTKTTKKYHKFVCEIEAKENEDKDLDDVFKKRAHLYNKIKESYRIYEKGEYYVKYRERALTFDTPLEFLFLVPPNLSGYRDNITNTSYDKVYNIAYVMTVENAMNAKPSNLVGVPVLLNDEYTKIFNMEKDKTNTGRNRDDVAIILADELPTMCIQKDTLDLKNITQSKVFFGNIFTGLGSGTFKGMTVNNCTLPSNIKYLESGCFSDCLFTGDFGCSDAVFAQLSKGGYKHNPETQIRIHKKEKKKFSNKINGENFTQYMDFFKAGEALRVYADRLTLVDEKGHESEYINNYQWNKFYDSMDGMTYLMLLSYYKVVTVSDVTGALVDIYNKRG